MAVIAADPSNLVAVGPNRPSSENTRRGFRVPTPASSSAASGRGTAPASSISPVDSITNPASTRPHSVHTKAGCSGWDNNRKLPLL
ncbi:unnamed protein product [Miscanthus lutarioriparius]|uniref:Uncharacterized protein n=1 Tax=Miscanthus lutarioriparius TaxID=422564 RepID=A0A811QLG8_9POAL|nr:unnamed protein product [Miscanthus lutarioriparius]